MEGISYGFGDVHEISSNSNKSKNNNNNNNDNTNNNIRKL